jgi:LacI family transcriptional regulator
LRKHARTLGLELDPLAEGEFGERGGAELTRQLLERHPTVTAMTTGGLSQAIGAMHTLWELGLRVPDDLSLVSFDDLALAEYLRPPLTTVRMPLAELGAAGVDALLSQLDGGEPRDVVVPTEPEVVVRASTGRPRA